MDFKAHAGSGWLLGGLFRRHSFARIILRIDVGDSERSVGAIGGVEAVETFPPRAGIKPTAERWSWTIAHNWTQTPFAILQEGHSFALYNIGCASGCGALRLVVDDPGAAHALHE